MEQPPWSRHGRETTALAETPRAPVHVQFEAQADETPDAPALIEDGTTSCSYAELDRLANRLAHHLVARGVLPGSLVGLCLARPAFQHR